MKIHDTASLDLNLLKVLLALSETRSVTAAALRLGMGQPAVSSALGRLRLSLGDPLFVRTGKSMEPTPRALAIVGPARQALEMIRKDVVEAAAFDPARSRQEFVIASSDIGEMVFLPRLLDRIGREAPGVRLRMESLSHGELQQALESGAVDLALGYFPDLKGNNIYQQRLFDHSFVCVVRKDHEISGSRITLRQFVQARHLVVTPQGRSQEVFEACLIRKGIERQVVLATPHFMSVPMIVAQSDLVATLPVALAATYSAMTAIRVLQPPFAVPRYTLRQHWHRRMNQDHALRWFRGLIAQLFAKPDGGWPVLPLSLPAAP